MPDKPAVAAYLAGYHSDLLNRELSGPERILAEEVMLDFMLDEPSLAARPASSGIDVGLQTLAGLVPAEAASAAARLSATILTEVRELEGRLARQGLVSEQMREHLVMLSERQRGGGG